MKTEPYVLAQVLKTFQEAFQCSLDSIEDESQSSKALSTAGMDASAQRTSEKRQT
ncbi:hypothetical protein HK102_006405, partial [Quaeritorhiza haematococci]